jgi:hypothetical protein
VAKPGQQRRLDVLGDRVVAVVAGEVGVVDQAAQRVGALGRPDRVGVDLRGAVEITE